MRGREIPHDLVRLQKNGQPDEGRDNTSQELASGKAKGAASVTLSTPRAGGAGRGRGRRSGSLGRGRR